MAETNEGICPIFEPNESTEAYGECNKLGTIGVKGRPRPDDIREYCRGRFENCELYQRHLAVTAKR